MSAEFFSIAGRAYDDLRQRMEEEMLEMLMWARVNREKDMLNARLRTLTGWGGSAVRAGAMRRLESGATC